jgi:hypothetical protein
MRRRTPRVSSAQGLFKGRRSTLSQSHGLIGSSFARRLRVESLEDRRLLAVTLGFTGPYININWTSTGITGGTTTRTVTVDGATGFYDYAVTLPPGTGVSQRTADFQLPSSPVTGSVTFDYVYTGNHRFFQSAAEFDTLVSGAPTTTVNQTTSGDFSFSGSATIVARAGQSFGFRIGGKNADFDSHIDGTLTVSNIKFHDSIIVDALGDVSDGNFGPGQLTLREAVELANAIPGADTITFAESMSGQTILLGGTQLNITEGLTIDATALAENVTIDAQQQSRVISFSAFPGDLTLSRLVVQNGRTTGNGPLGEGGGIQFLSTGTLTLIESTLSGNSTTGDGAYGGGIFAHMGRVTLTNSVLSGNSTAGAGAKGGAIYSDGGDVTLNQSTLSGNSTTGDSSDGGGINSYTGAVTLNQSTLSGNSTTRNFSQGGGIYSYSGAVTLNQSTLSGNSTEGQDSEGGGIYVSLGSVTLDQSTLTGNSTAGTGADGGGVFRPNTIANRPVTIRNSILAGNTVGSGSTGPDLVPDPQGNLTVNFSVIGTGITPTAGGNNFSTDAPQLGPLADNGGPTQTHALLPGSPALDAGDPNGGAIHNYEINGSVVDELGGPSLVVGGGFLLADGYQFGPNEGPQVSSAVTPDEYSIELVFSFDALGGFQKIIDFQDLAEDTGLYSNGTNLDFYGGAFAADVLSPGVPVHLVVTRDAATDFVAVYANGIEVLSFIDTGDIAVFSGISNVVRFFQDDNTTGGFEAASGFVDRIRIYDSDLSANEVAGLVFDQRGAGFNRVADGDGTPGARIDIGAYEAQVNPSADFDGDGDVDGRDFLAWQRGYGTPNAVRADGNSDDDADVDGSDLAAWQSQYGATGLNDLVAAVTAASEEPSSEPAAFDVASLVDAAMALAMMDTAIEETAAVIAQETFVNSAAFTSVIQSTLVTPSSGDSESLELTIENDTESDDPAAWLSDELLDAVFS